MTQPRLLARCPAKINLGLRVLGRRPDGYHELDTIFQAIDLWDTVEVSLADDLSLDCDEPGVESGEGNLVFRAARALRRRGAGETSGARLILRKLIPPGGGLGGGSSDAAGTLLALCRLWGLKLERRELSALAAELGSDVPFFLVGGTARGRGRGERVDPLPFPGRIPVLLGLPPLRTSTAEVYRHWSAARLTPHPNDVSLGRLFSHKLRRKKDFGFVINDLEEVVFRDHPELGEFRNELLREGADCARLSGSGSTVFGLFGREESAREACERLRLRYPRWTMVESGTIADGVRLEAVDGAGKFGATRAWDDGDNPGSCFSR